jgi:hypothetical protein
MYVKLATRAGGIIIHQPYIARIREDGTLEDAYNRKAVFYIAFQFYIADLVNKQAILVFR